MFTWDSFWFNWKFKFGKIQIMRLWDFKFLSSVQEVIFKFSKKIKKALTELHVHQHASNHHIFWKPKLASS